LKLLIGNVDINGDTVREFHFFISTFEIIRIIKIIGYDDAFIAMLTLFSFPFLHLFFQVSKITDTTLHILSDFYEDKFSHQTISIALIDFLFALDIHSEKVEDSLHHVMISLIFFCFVFVLEYLYFSIFILSLVIKH